MHDFLCIYFVWDPLHFYSLQVYIFHQIWGFWGHYFSNIFFSPSGTPKTQMSNLLIVYSSWGSIPFKKYTFTFTLQTRYLYIHFTDSFFTLPSPFLIFPKCYSFISVDICMESVYRQTAFITFVFSSAAAVGVISIRGSWKAGQRKWGGHREVPSLQMLRPSGLDLSRPGAASPLLEGFPCHQTSRKYVIHCELWATEKAVVLHGKFCS